MNSIMAQLSKSVNMVVVMVVMNHSLYSATGNVFSSHIHVSFLT